MTTNTMDIQTVVSLLRKYDYLLRKGREGNILFNDTLTHFIYSYMASDMVNDLSDSERGNSLPPYRLLFLINSKGSFICRQDNTYHGLCYTSHGELAGTRNSLLKGTTTYLLRRVRCSFMVDRPVMV